MRIRTAGRILFPAAGAAVFGLLCAGSVFANSIGSLSIEPTIESAGVIVMLSGTDDPGEVTLEVGEAGTAGYRRAHPFVRYDARHMASSLFGLKPGTAYTVRATLDGRTVTGSFTTRPEFSVPAPLRTVKVNDSARLRAAVAAARPGDEIVLAPGSYSGGITVAASGSSDHPVVIRGEVPAAEAAKPVEQRAGLPVIDGAGHSPVVRVTGSNVVLEGLRLENVRLVGIAIENARGDVVRDCQITGASSGWNHWVHVDGGGRDGGRHLIQDNHLVDTGSGFGYGILQDNGPGPGTVIRRNRITGFYDGINPSGNEGDLTDANLPEDHADVLGTWHNHSTDVYENDIGSSRDDDIEIDGIAVNMRIFRNRLSVDRGDECTNAVSVAPIAPGPFFIVRNVIGNFREGAFKFNTASDRGTIRNIYAYHNTIRNDGGAARRGTILTLWEGAGDQGSPSKNVSFRNNIFLGDTKLLIQRLVTVHTPDYDPNIWYTEGASGTLVQWGKNGPYYDTFDAWRQATGQEARGLYADPLVGSGFRLMPGSPAIDRAVPIPGINDAFSGKAPDMGAFEYVMATSPGTPGPGVPPAQEERPQGGSFHVAGRVTTGGAVPVPGVTVTLSGDASRTAVTDAQGCYRFDGLPAGDYRIGASSPGYSFSPAGEAEVRLSADLDARDFTGQAVRPEADLSEAYVLPNPWTVGRDVSPLMVFKRLTEGTSVRIYTLTGELVTELRGGEAAEIAWNPVEADVASGVYYCVLRNERGERKSLKIAVIR